MRVAQLGLWLADTAASRTLLAIAAESRAAARSLRTPATRSAGELVAVAVARLVNPDAADRVEQDGAAARPGCALHRRSDELAQLVERVKPAALRFALAIVDDRVGDELATGRANGVDPQVAAGLWAGRGEAKVVVSHVA